MKRLTQFKRLLDSIAPRRLQRAGLIVRMLLHLLRGAIALALCHEAGRATGKLLTTAPAAAGLESLLQLAMLAVAMTLVGAVLGFAREKQHAGAIARLHARLFRALTNMPLTYHQQHNAASLQTDLERASALVTRLLIDTVPYAPAALTILLAAGWLLASISLPIAVALCAMLSALLTLTWLAMRWVRRTATRTYTAHGEVMATLGDLLAHIASIKVFSAGAWRAKHFDALTQRALTAALANAVVLNTVAPVLFAGVIVLTLTIVVTNMQGHLGAPLSPDQVVMLTGYAWVMASQMTALGRAVSALHQSAPALATLEPLLEPGVAQVEVNGPGPWVHKAAGNGTTARATAPLGVKVQHVQFGYSADHRILAGINLTLAPGSFTAIRGPNGAGKSTLAYLLLGLVQADAGTIMLTDTDRQMSPQHMPGNLVGWAPQIPQLLLGSVADNVMLGRDATESGELEQVLTLTGCSDFISTLRDGVHTQIGDGQAILSGGQQQRLCLARALFGRPGLLVLDEALSMLPPEDELRILQGIRTSLAPAPTLLCMTHRQHVLDMAQSCWALDAGVLHAVAS